MLSERYKNGENEHKQHSMLSALHTANATQHLYLWVSMNEHTPFWVVENQQSIFSFQPTLAGIMMKNKIKKKVLIFSVVSSLPSEWVSECERERERKFIWGKNEKLTAQEETTENGRESEWEKNESASNPTQFEHYFCFFSPTFYTTRAQSQSQIHPFCWVFYFISTDGAFIHTKWNERS